MSTDTDTAPYPRRAYLGRSPEGTRYGFLAPDETDEAAAARLRDAGWRSWRFFTVLQP